MKNINGNSPQKSSFVLSRNENLALVLELFILMMAGAFAMFLHYSLRIPLNMPGHHGLEFMAIFTIVRMSSNLRYAATIATLGTGILLLIPGMGAVNPLHSFSYLLPGILLDFLFFTGGKQSRWFIFVVLSAGIAYMSIPLSRFFIHLITGFPEMAFIKHGVIYTILSFFLFGILGGMLGFGLENIKSFFLKNQKP